MAKFTVEAELYQDRNPIVSGEGVKFEYRWDGHYAQFKVVASSHEDAVRRLVASTDDVDTNGSFFTDQIGVRSNFAKALVTRCYQYDDSGELVRDEEF